MQPEKFRWNIMDMMSNYWYTVNVEEGVAGEDGFPAVLFRHPTLAASLEGGWVQPWEEVWASHAAKESEMPQMQFTREEIKKHNNKQGC